ncbi:Asp23/Gls24 family envelope stress response protein [Pseudonocardia alni]|uniref:Asp23/Gls24 family envelope stress response protein n=1 Tax=Pseudonocardia alni TaxID=33907 RepID=UPI0033D5F35C
MTTTEPIGPASGAGRHRALADPGERGTLTIDDTVVDTIAAAALEEVDGIGGAARRVLGLAVGDDGGGRRPRTSSTVSGNGVAITATVAVDYPLPVTATVDRARAHTAARVLKLTGLSVVRVDVTVAALTTDHTRNRRELS